MLEINKPSIFLAKKLKINLSIFEDGILHMLIDDY